MDEYLLIVKIKELADQSGKSLNEIERDLGYPRNALNNYGHVRNPSAKRLFELSAYFGVSPEYLMGDSLSRMIYSTERLFNHLSNEQKKEMNELYQNWAQDNIPDSGSAVELLNDPRA